MRAYIIAAALLTPIALTSLVAHGESPATQAAQKYTTADTDIGTLLDDPDARAILDKHLPGFTADSQVDMARGMTLKGIQPYAENITDTVLAAIDADLAAMDSNKKK